MPATTDSDHVRDWPLWWFSRLEAAIDRGDYQAAADAQRELSRLGIKVHYPGRYRMREVVTTVSQGSEC